MENTGNGEITGQIALGAAADGPYDVMVTATGNATGDPNDIYSASQEFTWTVTCPLTITQTADQTNYEGASVSVNVSASGGCRLVFGATGLPNGLSINESSGVISGKIAAGDAANGPYSVLVLAGNGTSSASEVFNWNILTPLAIVIPADQTNNEGDKPTLTIMRQRLLQELLHGHHLRRHRPTRRTKH